MIINFSFCSLLLHPDLNNSSVVCKFDSNEFFVKMSFRELARLDTQNMMYTHTPPTGQ